jgi:hypothetical protein
MTEKNQTAGETQKGLVETLTAMQLCADNLQPEGENRFLHIRVIYNSLGLPYLTRYETFQNLEFAVREGYAEKMDSEFGPSYRPVGDKLKKFLEQRH